MQIAKRLVKVVCQIRPGPVHRAMAGNDHIIGAGARARGQFGAGKRTQPAARPVTAHGIPCFFRSCKAKPPLVATRRHGLQNKTGRDSLYAAGARCKKTGTRRDADQTGHGGVIP